MVLKHKRYERNQKGKEKENEKKATLIGPAHYGLMSSLFFPWPAHTIGVIPNLQHIRARETSMAVNFFFLSFHQI
jgi:hypothetical protein